MMGDGLLPSEALLPNVGLACGSREQTARDEAARLDRSAKDRVTQDLLKRRGAAVEPDWEPAAGGHTT